MDRRIFHGPVNAREFGQALVAQFNRGNLRSQLFSKQGKVIVQVGTRIRPISGGNTALTIYLEQVEDGVAVQVGEQAWLGIAASIGTTILSVWRNPFNLIHRLDDIAQDVENIQISDQVWQVIENYAQMRGATFELSKRFRRMTCGYCETANPVGESRCLACGAPLGDVQPDTCQNCGYVVSRDEEICPNCAQPLRIYAGNN
jgi:predicted Zn-ribbon and HTH transcriptional regulator